MRRINYLKLTGAILVLIALILDSFVIHSIFNLSIILIVLGVSFMGFSKKIKESMKRKKVSKIMANILLSLAAIIIFLLIAEIILHLALPPAYQATSKYGLDHKENSSGISEIEDSPGYKHNVTVNYTTKGFKRWGDINTNKTKMLIIGDSFTEMNKVSNGGEWYAYMEKEFPNVEFFVKGVGNFGSLQEYMILNATIDEINPEIILWQFCSNDYADNIYSLTKNCYPRRNLAIRPYLEEGLIVYRQPVPFESLREYSRIADYSLKKYDAILTEKCYKNITACYSETLKRHKLIWFEGENSQAYNITLQIMLMVKERANDRLIFLFNSFDDTPARAKSLNKICLKTNITLIEKVSESIVIRGKNENLTVEVVNDGHWNMAGNRFAGEYLADYFRNNAEFMDILEEHEKD